MSKHFPVEISNRVKNEYRYKPSSPLIDEKGNFLRGYFVEELIHVIEISEKALNPGKTNAKDIPEFLFFDSEVGEPICPKIIIPENTDKYYCLLRSFSGHLEENGNFSKNYPDTPQALQNIIFLHLTLMMKEIEEKNHPLPITVLYKLGMNSNHVGIAALRISNIADPSQNEIMLINPLGGYIDWETAAINGLSEAMQHKAKEGNKEKSPAKIIITPATYDRITQAPQGMRSSCSAITAAIACAIRADLSFIAQKENLVEYMRTLCGKENEAALRRDHQKLLSLLQFSNEADLTKATAFLMIFERHRNYLPTLPTSQKFIPSLKTNSSNNYSMFVVSGFVTVLGVSAMALAFTVLNLPSLGIAGLIIAGIGPANILLRMSLFSAKSSEINLQVSEKLLSNKLLTC